MSTGGAAGQGNAIMQKQGFLFPWGGQFGARHQAEIGTGAPAQQMRISGMLSRVRKTWTQFTPRP